MALLHLSPATRAFVVASGDSGFLADIPVLERYLTVASIALIVFGATTLWGIVGIMQSRAWVRRVWLALALFAVPLHLLWLPAALIGMGDVRHYPWSVALMWLRMASVPVLFGLVWLRLKARRRSQAEIVG